MTIKKFAGVEVGDLVTYLSPVYRVEGAAAIEMDALVTGINCTIVGDGSIELVDSYDLLIEQKPCGLTPATVAAERVRPKTTQGRHS